jgi:hypothetical protein
MPGEAAKVPPRLEFKTVSSDCVSTSVKPTDSDYIHVDSGKVTAVSALRLSVSDLCTS